jgi:hypothetical protein
MERGLLKNDQGRGTNVLIGEDDRAVRRRADGVSG